MTLSFTTVVPIDIQISRLYIGLAFVDTSSYVASHHTTSFGAECVASVFIWGLGGCTSPLYPLIKTITAIIFYLARLIKYIKHLFLFIVCIATQVVILPPHIPWKGQWGGILLLRYSMLCFNGLVFGKAVIVILNVLYLGSKDYFIF